MSEKDKHETGRREMLNNVNDGHNIFGGNEEVSAERRPMLKGLAVSVGSILGLGGTAAASDGDDELRRKTEAAMDGYNTRSGVDAALDKHGSGLLTQLAGSNLASSMGTEDFYKGDVNAHKAPAEVDPDEGTYVTASEYEGTFSAHISVVKKTPNHVIQLNIRPQLDSSFATIKTRDGDLLNIVDPDVEGVISAQSESTSDDVTIQKTCGQDGYTCPPGVCCTLCSVMVKHEKICCLYPDGSQGCYTQPIDKCCEPITCC